MFPEGLKPIDDQGTAMTMFNCGRITPRTAAIANNIAVGGEKIAVCSNENCAGRIFVTCVATHLSNVDGSQSVELSKTTMTPCIDVDRSLYNLVCGQYCNLS